MKIKFEQSFIKSIGKLKDATLKKKIATTFVSLELAGNIAEIK